MRERLIYQRRRYKETERKTENTEKEEEIMYRQT